MPKEIYRKLDIAGEYLIVAADLYFAERYSPAIALAAIAEEIFEAVMRARNESHATANSFRTRPSKTVSADRQDSIAIARAINPNLRRRTDLEIYRLLYRAKNSSKHGTTKDGRKPDLQRVELVVATIGQKCDAPILCVA